MISLRPSLITEHHSVSSLNEESRKSRRNLVSDMAENPGFAGALSRAAQENDAVPLERGAELPRPAIIGVYTWEIDE